MKHPRPVDHVLPSTWSGSPQRVTARQAGELLAYHRASVDPRIEVGPGRYVYPQLTYSGGGFWRLRMIRNQQPQKGEK